MLDFPNAPAVGDKYPPSPPAGSPVYLWDGEKWTSSAIAKPGYLPLSGGTLTGALLLNADPSAPLGAATRQYADMPTMGVTDGSDAAAGRVGQIVSAIRTTALAVPATTPTRVAMLTVPPGDWDIYGELWSTASAGNLISSFWSALSAVDAGVPGAVDMSTARSQFGAAASAVQVVPIGPTRASVSVATPYYLNCLFNLVSGTISATGKIWARRAR